MGMPTSPTGRTISELSKLYEAFIDSVAPGLEGFEVAVSETIQFSPTEIAHIEKLVKGRVPDDLRAFWIAGFRNLAIYDLEMSTCANTSFLHAAGVVGQITTAHEVSAIVPPDPTDADMVEADRLLQFGIPLQEEENYCLVDADPTKLTGVRRMGNDPPPAGAKLVPIAPSFTAWFESFLAAGLYNHGDARNEHFSAYWNAVGPKVPLHVPPRQNGWLRYLTTWYEGETLG